jgi:hypothetical protein
MGGMLLRALILWRQSWSAVGLLINIRKVSTTGIFPNPRCLSVAAII